MNNKAVVDGLVNDGLWDPYNDIHMGHCAEVCATEYGFTREVCTILAKMFLDWLCIPHLQCCFFLLQPFLHVVFQMQDEFALESLKRAQRAVKERTFQPEIVPVEYSKRGATHPFSASNHSHFSFSVLFILQRSFTHMFIILCPSRRLCMYIQALIHTHIHLDI